MQPEAASDPNRLTTLASVAGTAGLFRIADAADHVGVSPSALRLWERQGLIAPVRTAGRERRYSSADLARLRRIRRLRQAEGLNAAAIRRILAAEDPVGHGTDGRSAAAAGSTPALDDAPAPQAGSPLPARPASRLRRFRTERSLSLRAVADRTGLSPSFISSVERSQSGASVAALRRLADAYGTTLGDLLQDRALEGGRLVRPADRQPLDLGGGVSIEDLSAASSVLESQLFTLAPGASSDGYYSHAGEEFLFVLAGRLAIWLAEHEYYELATGDALSFPSTLAHRFRALGTAETRLIWINTPPTF